VCIVDNYNIFKKIQDAYDTLSDPDKKHEYVSQMPFVPWAVGPRWLAVASRKARSCMSALCACGVCRRRRAVLAAGYARAHAL
jgi:hypothetical protein